MPVNNDDITNRINRLVSNDTTILKNPTDEELAQRFTNVFSTKPISTTKTGKNSFNNYHIPDDLYSSLNIDEEIENILQEEDGKDDALDEYIYNIIKTEKDDSTSLRKNKQKDDLNTSTKLDQIQNIFLGNPSLGNVINNDEEDELIQRLQTENSLEIKYNQFMTKRDQDLEERYLKFKANSPAINFTANSSKPRGSVPKPISDDDLLHDEIDDWCCKVYTYIYAYINIFQYLVLIYYYVRYMQ
ncbi:uncharacterized protein BX663DRAFT_498805 [Cokeromyces recurvatus]|uniref:uncharacterized protein n=1 Tax=Cokeromyces recurvatus TaxID=90255 RepID=UPI00221FCFAF|nr:uncharacterized protein BX663DRAFT_498805 [Cokeromyces recurvatus]KAI7906107.1 hypothetical protein BX663DRAFT_498805 [Cokeromyces recurvatus]